MDSWLGDLAWLGFLCRRLGLDRSLPWRLGLALRRLRGSRLGGRGMVRIGRNEYVFTDKKFVRVYFLCSYLVIAYQVDQRICVLFSIYLYLYSCLSKFRKNVLMIH